MIDKTDLLHWLNQIDEQLKTKTLIIAVGGTAMTLRGLKSSTRDVDFCVEGKNLKIFRELTKDSKFKVDLFSDGFIFSEQLPEDYIDKSDKLESNLTNIELRTLSLADIIITKSARYNERDEEDIAAIAKTKKVDKTYLEKRFKQVRNTFVGNQQVYEYHFNLVLSRHFK